MQIDARKKAKPVHLGLTDLDGGRYFSRRFALNWARHFPQKIGIAPKRFGPRSDDRRTRRRGELAGELRQRMQNRCKEFEFSYLPHLISKLKLKPQLR